MKNSRAILEIRASENTGIFYVLDNNDRLEFFPRIQLEKGPKSFFKEIRREEIKISTDLLKPKKEEAGNVKKGDALLPEEERTLFIWDQDKIQISTEEKDVIETLFYQSEAVLDFIIERPGANSYIWNVPFSVVAIK